MIEKNPTKVASSLDEILLNPTAPVIKKPKKIVESMNDLIDMIEVTLQAKNKYKLGSNAKSK
jgi:hypothetical protein